MPRILSETESPTLIDMRDTQALKTWMCLICGFIYDEAVGMPDEGVAPGAYWEEFPVSGVCPECNAGKTDFEMVVF